MEFQYSNMKYRLRFYTVRSYCCTLQSRIAGLTDVERPPGVVVRSRARRSFPHTLAETCKLTVPFLQPPLRWVVVSLKGSGDFGDGSLLEVRDTGALTFNGDVIIRQINHADTVLEVVGSAE